MNHETRNINFMNPLALKVWFDWCKHKNKLNFKKFTSDNRETPFYFFPHFSDNHLHKYLENGIFYYIFKNLPPPPIYNVDNLLFDLKAECKSFSKKNQPTLSWRGEGRGLFGSLIICLGFHRLTQ